MRKWRLGSEVICPRVPSKLVVKPGSLTPARTLWHSGAKGPLTVGAACLSPDTHRHLQTHAPQQNAQASCCIRHLLAPAWPSLLPRALALPLPLWSAMEHFRDEGLLFPLPPYDHCTHEGSVMRVVAQCTHTSPQPPPPTEPLPVT